MLHLLPFSAVTTAPAFVLSSAGKVTSRAAFERAISDLRPVPQRHTKPLALAVLAAEGAVVFLIVAPQEESLFMKDYKFVETPIYRAFDAQGVVQSSGLPFPGKGAWGMLTPAWEQAVRSAATSHSGEVISSNIAQL